MDTSQCLLYVAGLCLTFAFDDLSFKATASQSTTQAGSQIMYGASNAVDRNTATCTRTDQIGNTSPKKTEWWKVDLGETFKIYSINILFRNYDNFEYRQRGRLAGFSLLVSNTDTVQDSTLCYKDGKPQLPPLNFTTECIESGRYVIFYNERLDGVTYPTGYELSNVFIELCEVIVKGCKAHDVYGSKCDIPCPIKCKGKCHIKSGACLDCENGAYGDYCNLSCPANCKNNTCHTRNGTCLDCKHEVYGSYCNTSCPVNCRDNICHVQKGICFNCKTGWIGIECETKCTEGWYGDNCNQQCSVHCRGNSPCNHVTGQCDGMCDAGWTGVMCENECINETYGHGCVNNCSGHCINNSPCNKQTGHCDRGCNLGYTNSDCSKKCESGFYGMNCSNLCSGHCENNEPCNYVSGLCPDGCQDGYIGARCNSSCKAGSYGKNCSFQCSSNCNKTCAPIDGSCEDCKDGSKSYCSKGSIVLRQNVSSLCSWDIGLLISLVINFIFIIGVCLLCRGIYTKKVSISRDVLCSNKIYYTDTSVKIGENSTYQELDLSREEILYQNTTIR